MSSLRVYNLKVFWSYFMFSQGQGQVVQAAQPRQSCYLVPPGDLYTTQDIHIQNVAG